MKYKKQLKDGTMMIIMTCTITSLIGGIALLPTRRSPVRFTVGGFVAGVGISYGFWRLQLYQYDKKINQLFRKIVTDKFY